MKIFRYISGFAAALMLTGCMAEDLSLPTQSDYIDNGDTFTVKVSLDVPDMAQTMTRAMGQTPDYENLQLYVIEFDGSGDNPASSFFSRMCNVTSQIVSEDKNKVIFTLQLYKETSPKVLHLIAVPKGVEITVTEPQSEAVILPNIIVSGGNDAYWQRIAFPNGYGTLTGSVTDEGGVQFIKHATLESDLTDVPMIRNFCAVEVLNSASTFTLDGFVVINTPKRGIVAPWNQDHTYFEPYLDSNDKQIPFATLRETYSGNIPEYDYNTTPSETELSLSTKYLYESPFSTSNPTRVIIKGTYNNKTNYYKIDIGESDSDTNEFINYNLLRNFKYVVNITSVTSEGYDTYVGAVDGSVANNISYDVSTLSMPTVSNGTDMLQVSYTYKILTDDDDREFEFSYRYRKDIESGTATYLGPDDGITTTLTTGAAIAAISEPVMDTSTGWVTYKLKAQDPSEGQLRQSFVVRNTSTGLARTVEIVLASPFEITRNEVYGGTYSVGDEFPYKLSDYRSKVHYTLGAPLTVFFTIPDNLPKSIFPLRFVFEADNQNIENNQVGNLVVSSDESLFGTGKTTIRYTKTISWTDYNTRLTVDSPTGVMVAKRDDNGDVVDSDGNVIGNGNVEDLSEAQLDDVVWQHHVRARFTTITGFDSATDAAAEGITTIRIYNRYFCLGTPDTDQSKPGTTTGTKGGVVEVSFTRADISGSLDSSE